MVGSSFRMIGSFDCTMERARVRIVGPPEIAGPLVGSRTITRPPGLSLGSPAERAVVAGAIGKELRSRPLQLGESASNFLLDAIRARLCLRYRPIVGLLAASDPERMSHRAFGVPNMQLKERDRAWPQKVTMSDVK